MTGTPDVRQRVLVTGAAGFVGSHLCPRLADEGLKVRALVRDGGTTIDFAGRDIELVPGDLRILKLVRAINSGRFVMLGSGDVRYQMIYIDDLLEGICLCGESEHCVGQTYILSNDSPVTLNGLVEMIADRLDVPRPRLHLPVTPVYLLSILCEYVCKLLKIQAILYRRRVNFFRKQRYFDITRACTELGSAPRTTLENGLAQTIEWYCKYRYL